MTKLLYPGQTDGKSWVMKDGSIVPVANMDDKHLNNSIEMLMRGIKSRQESVSSLLKERDRRKQLKEEAKKLAIHKTPIGRLFPDESP